MILTNDEIEVLKKIGENEQLHECLVPSRNGLAGLLNLKFAESFLINQDPYVALTASGKEVYLRLKNV